MPDKKDTIEVLLADGFGFMPSVRAVKEYIKRAGKSLFVYRYKEYDEDAADDGMIRIDDEYLREDYEEPISYIVTSRDLGRIAKHGDAVKYSTLLCERTDKVMIEVIKDLKAKAVSWVPIRIAEIPDDIEWHIDFDAEDCFEYVREGPPPPRYRTWCGVNVSELA